MIYPFVDKPRLFNETSVTNRLYHKVKNGEKLDESEQHTLAFYLKNGSTGIMRYGGWAYDLRSYLNLYWVDEYDHISRMYGLNKKFLRKCCGVLSRSRIVLVLEKGKMAYK